MKNDLLVYKGYITILKDKKEEIISSFKRNFSIEFEREVELKNANYLALTFVLVARINQDDKLIELLKNEAIMALKAIEFSSSKLVNIYTYYSFNSEGLKITSKERDQLYEDDIESLTNPSFGEVKTIIY